MANLFTKAILLVALIIFVHAQATGSRTFPNPDPSWDEYQIKSCCPKGFYEVNNYCVQCIAPNVFDSIDQRCRPCPADHIYDDSTQSCVCKIPCPSPRVLNGKSCECPADGKGIARVWNPTDKSCNCPSNLPLWNGKYCVACPAGTEFDPK